MYFSGLNTQMHHSWEHLGILSPWDIVRLDIVLHGFLSLWGFVPLGFCPPGLLSHLDFVPLGFCPHGFLSSWVFVFLGFCPLGYCPMGFCPVGFCPRTVPGIAGYIACDARTILQGSRDPLARSPRRVQTMSGLVQSQRVLVRWASNLLELF